MRTRVVLDAPSNLGLRPPRPAPYPAATSWPAALREHRIVQRLGAFEGGVVVPPRYDLGDWQEGDGVFNADAIARYTRTLADRIEGHVRAGEFPVVLGGDCSIQLGATLALRRIGRYGLAALDGSADFRHPGNSDRIGAHAAARNWRSPPGADSPVSPTWKGSDRISGTRTSGSSACGTTTRTAPR